MTRNIDNRISLQACIFSVIFVVSFTGLIGCSGEGPNEGIQAVAEASSAKVMATVNGKDGATKKKQPKVLWGEENVSLAGNHSQPLQSQLIPDGVGGVIVVWRDDRNYNPAPPPFPDPFLTDPGLIFDPPPEEPKFINIYAQHLNSRGDITWALGGVPLSMAAGGQYFPQLVSDGEGGAIVVWEDYRSADGANSLYSGIYAQRIGQDGSVLWSSDAAICSAVNSQEKPKITSDGSGGAFIVWQDYRSGGYYEVYAQRINGDGEPQWAVDGVAISTVPNNPRPLFPEIIADGSDGAIIVWQDYSVGEFFIYAQKIDEDGVSAWEDNGVSVSSVHAAYQHVPRPLSDGSGGAIIAWLGDTYENDENIWAQRINGNGELQWGAEGARIPSSPSGRSPQIASDENGGVIIAWENNLRDIYAQRLDSSGTIQWPADAGVPICTAENSQYDPQITSDNMGGAIITWYDYRNYGLVVDDSIQGMDVYAQRINKEGEVLWKTDGAEISTEKLHQARPKIVTDGYGGAVIIWDDSRASSGVDVYGKRISVKGKHH